MYSYTQPREAILDYRHWLLRQDGTWRSAELAEGKKHGKGIIVRLAGIDDRDQAAGLIDCDIAVERDAMPEAEEGSFYWTDLEGLRIVRSDGTELGQVAYLMETGANDVMVTTGKPERLIPFIMGEVVVDVDLAEGLITVDWELD